MARARLRRALVAAALLVATAAAADEALPVPFPSHFRAWRHVKSMVIFGKNHPLFEAFAGFHHVYVNWTGYRAWRKKEPFPKGTVFVLDMKDAKESEGSWIEGPRKYIAVMVRDPDAYAATAGWGWQVFTHGRRGRPALKSLEEQQACSVCHRAAETKQFVFSELQY